MDRTSNTDTTKPGTSTTQPAVQDNSTRTILRTQAQPNMLVKVQDYLFLFLRNWKWFLLSLLVTLSIAYYNNKKAVPIYYRSASILIKGDERNFGNSDALSQLGINMTPRSVTNEIIALTTSELAGEVAKRLHLDYNYYREGSFHDNVVYGIDLIADVRISDLNDRESAALTLNILPDSTVVVSDLVKNGESCPNSYKSKLNTTFVTPIGNITVTTTPSYKAGAADRLLVRRIGLPAAAGMVAGRLSAAQKGSSSMILIDYRDESPARAEDVLNTVVTVYNENWIRDRNLVTIGTNEFIRERLAVIENELGAVETDISDYKSINLMTTGADIDNNRVSTAEDNDIQLENMIYMTKYVKSYLTDGLHENQLLPSNSVISNPTIEAQIAEYNNIILRRNNHLANSSAQNPLVQDLEQTLAIMRNSIIQGLDNELIMLQTQKMSNREQYHKAVDKVSASPWQSTYLQAMERQQKVKESLYLFLLQKREENELSQAFTAYNSRLIESPHGPWAPFSPQPTHNYIMALIFGFLIPAGIISVREAFNTTIRGKKDLENLTVPFVGETPLDVQSEKIAKAEKKKKLDNRKKGRRYTEAMPQLVVKEKSRNVMNEAFRVVRSNLEFILGFENKTHVIMITSMNPSSGKTFISANLGTSLALNGKRVLCVDLDMRKGSLSKYVGRPHMGVSNYLSGQVDDYHGLIIPLEKIDVFPCGTLPPNPAELLYSPIFTSMLNEMKEEYDYIFLDCPPVEVVADAAIINRYADMTLFVVRAHLMDRAFLPDIEKWYEEKRYNNLCIILNGTTDAFTHYGYHRYGYRYGYHYGSYGYGYGNEKGRH